MRIEYEKYKSNQNVLSNESLITRLRTYKEIHMTISARCISTDLPILRSYKPGDFSKKSLETWGLSKKPGDFIGCHLFRSVKFKENFK